MLKFIISFQFSWKIVVIPNSNKVLKDQKKIKRKIYIYFPAVNFSDKELIYINLYEMRINLIDAYLVYFKKIKIGAIYNASNHF